MELRNRHMIGDVICHAVFFPESVVGMRGKCKVYIGDDSFIISKKLFNLIARPAP